jgi:thioredoxin 1
VCVGFVLAPLCAVTVQCVVAWPWRCITPQHLTVAGALPLLDSGGAHIGRLKLRADCDSFLTPISAALASQFVRFFCWFLSFSIFRFPFKYYSSHKSVFFSSHAGGPCKFIGPQFEALAHEADNSTVVFAKVDVDDAEDVAADQKIQAMPTFKFYKGGKQIAEMMGADLAKLKSLLAEHK